MAQAITIDNFFPIQNILEWPEAVSKLEWSQGKQFADHTPTVTYNVTGVEGKGVWELTMGEKDGVKGVYAKLDNEMSWNDPTLGGLHTAEDLLTRLRQLREVNTAGQRGLQDVDTSEFWRQHETSAAMAKGGFDNKFQVRDPMSWAESTQRLMGFGDIEKDGKVVIKTSAEGLSTGVYTLTLIQEPDFLGLAVDLDGAPTFNYPRPHLRSAEEIVEVILKLHAMYSKGVRPRDFQFDLKDGDVVIASAKSGQSEVKLFENGLITISNPGLMQLSSTAAENIVAGLGELVDKALDQE